MCVCLHFCSLMCSVEFVLKGLTLSRANFQAIFTVLKSKHNECYHSDKDWRMHPRGCMLFRNNFSAVHAIQSFAVCIGLQFIIVLYPRHMLFRLCYLIVVAAIGTQTCVFSCCHIDHTIDDCNCTLMPLFKVSVWLNKLSPMCA